MLEQNVMTIRLLNKAELGMAEGILLTMDAENPRCESWGFAPLRDLSLCETYGLFVQQTLASAFWLDRNNQVDTAEIVALAIPPGRWGMGLVSWLAEQAGRIALDRGAGTLLLRLESGGQILGNELKQAGFSGSIDASGFPRGNWCRKLV